MFNRVKDKIVQGKKRVSEGRRREPCYVCELPVFIAQRLRVGGHLYHRTCFKCARCSAQLNPVDCYERSEGKYCCVTCTDEMDRPTDPPPPIPPARHQQQRSLVVSRRQMFELGVGSEGSGEPTRFDNNDVPPLKKPLRLSALMDTSSAISSLETSAKDLSNNDNVEPVHTVVPSTSIMTENHDGQPNLSDFIDKPSKPTEPVADSEIVSKTEEPEEKPIGDDADAPISSKTDSVLEEQPKPEPVSENVPFADDEPANPELPREAAVAQESAHNVVLEVISLMEEIVKENEKTKGIEPECAQAESNLVEKTAEETREPQIGAEEDLKMELKESTSTQVSKAAPGEEKPTEDSIEPDKAMPTQVLKIEPEAETPTKVLKVEPVKKPSDYPVDLNPFGDDDESEIRVEPPPRKMSTNPFGSDSEEESEMPPKPIARSTRAISTPSLNPFSSDEDDDPPKPVPLPRKKNISPEPSPMPRTRLRASGRSMGSVSSFSSFTTPRKKNSAPPPPSTPGSATSTLRRKKNRAPPPPVISSPAATSTPVRTESGSKVLTLSLPVSPDEGSSLDTLPPAPAQSRDASSPDILDADNISAVVQNFDEITSKIQSMLEESKKKDEELERETSRLGQRRRIPVVAHDSDDEALDKSLEAQNLIHPYSTLGSSPPASYTEDSSYQDDFSRSPPTEKTHKDSTNEQVKSTKGLLTSVRKSSLSDCKRKKAPAPFPPVRPNIQPMSLQKIKQELEDIEVKQEGLERQGVALEEQIRLRFSSESSVTPYVEELVLQLFELVNEKNALFRRQAELLYMRRQYHLEEEHAELENQIRCLMARPESNKTDSDKELEEFLIQRLVEVVEMRDSIVQCLERDRLREVEEDKSVNAQLNKFSAAMNTKPETSASPKSDHKSLSSVDSDTERRVDGSVEKEHKKKRKWFSLHLKGKH